VQPLFITRFTSTSAAGRGSTALWHALQSGTSGLTPNDFGPTRLDCWIGRVAALESEPLEPDYQEADCRNNRLAWLGLRQDGFTEAVEGLKHRVDPRRIGLFLGTSTSGILSTEDAFRAQRTTATFPASFPYRQTHDLFSVTAFVRHRLGLSGPAHTVSTACSSSAKVFGDAHRFIAAGLCDAAVVGGVDSLCLTTLFGFHSLALVSARPCRPFDRARDGISIAEAAGFMILEKAPRTSGDPALLGYGESSDAYHLSAPRPDGAGAVQAMTHALRRAGLEASDIDYVNLHGTATPLNDRLEAKALASLTGAETPCSSTKGWTGHTLGAAGITEAVIACLCLQRQWVPGTLNCGDLEPDLGIRVLQESCPAPVRRVMSNSFGFGGSNCSLILGTPA